MDATAQPSRILWTSRTSWWEDRATRIRSADDQAAAAEVLVDAIHGGRGEFIQV